VGAWRCSSGRCRRRIGYAVELRHHAFYDDPLLEARVEQLLGEHGGERISLDAAVPATLTDRSART
jgi:hypothetical protein